MNLKVDGSPAAVCTGAFLIPTVLLLRSLQRQLHFVIYYYAMNNTTLVKCRIEQ